jgi:hypothetical protein
VASRDVARVEAQTTTNRSHTLATGWDVRLDRVVDDGTRSSHGYLGLMQRPLTPPMVLAALVVSAVATETPTAPPPAPEPIQEIANVPATGPLPHTGSCPAYQGPQCDSLAHQQWANGQDLAKLVPRAA